MEFGFEFLEDILILGNRLFQRVVVFSTPFLLHMVDSAIRTYLWIQNLPFFQQNTCKYADILASDSWNYTGFLVSTHSTMPFSAKYDMIHYYDTEEKNPKTVCTSSVDTIDALYLLQNQKICVCRKTPFTFAKPEKSQVRFLYIEFVHKGNTVTLDIPEEMMQVGNEIFTPAFLYRLLDHSSTTFRFLFDLDYRLILVDEYLNTSNLDSSKYILLEKNTYCIRFLSETTVLRIGK